MFINVAIVTQNWNNIAPNIYVSIISLLSSAFFTKKSALTVSVCFQKKFPNSGHLNLAPNRFRNSTNDTFKLLGHNHNHL